MVGPIKNRSLPTGTALHGPGQAAPTSKATLDPWLRAPEPTTEPVRATHVQHVEQRMGAIYDALAADDVAPIEWMQPMEEAWMQLSGSEQALARHSWTQALLQPGPDTDAVGHERLFMRQFFPEAYEAMLGAAIEGLPATPQEALPKALTQASTRFVRDVADALLDRRMDAQRDDDFGTRKDQLTPEAVTYRNQREQLMRLLEQRAVKGDLVPPAELLRTAHIALDQSRSPERTQGRIDERRAMRVIAKTARGLTEVPDGKTRWGTPKVRVEVEFSKGRKRDFENLYGWRTSKSDKSWTEDKSRLLLGAQIVASGESSPTFRKLMDKAAPQSRDDILYEPAMVRAALDKDAVKVEAHLAGAARMLERTLDALGASLSRGPVSAAQMKAAMAAIPADAKGLPFPLVAGAALRVRHWIAEGLAAHPDTTGALAMIDTVGRLAEGLSSRHQMHVCSCLMSAVRELEDHVSADHAPALEHTVSRLLAGQKDADVAWHHLSGLDTERPGAEDRKARIADWLLQGHARTAQTALAAPSPDREGAARAMRASFNLRDRMQLDVDTGPEEVRAAYALMGMAYAREAPARLEAAKALIGDRLAAYAATPTPRSAVGATMLFSALSRQFRYSETDVIVAQLQRGARALEAIEAPEIGLGYAQAAFQLLDTTVDMKRGPLHGEDRGVRYDPDAIRALVDAMPGVQAGLTANADPAALGAGLALVDAVLSALPLEHAARPDLETAAEAGRRSEAKVGARAEALGAALTRALGALPAPEVLDARVGLLGDLKALLYEVMDVASVQDTLPLRAFAQTPTEAERGKAVAGAEAMRAAVERAHAAGEIPEGSVAHHVTELAEALVSPDFDAAAAEAARDAAEAKIDEADGPRRGRAQRNAGFDDEARPPAGTHLDVALGKLAFPDGKIRPREVLVGRNDIAQDLDAVGRAVVTRPDAEVADAQVEALTKGLRLLEGLLEILPGRNTPLADALKAGLPGIKGALRRSEAEASSARADREVALGQLDALLTEGYGTFNTSKDRDRAIEYGVRYGVVGDLVNLREHLVSGAKGVPEFGTFATGKLLGRLQVILHSLPAGYPVKADLQGKLERVEADIAAGRITEAYAHLEPAATATLGLTADPKVDEELAKVGLAAKGPERVPMKEVRAGDCIRYREVGGRLVHGYADEVKERSLLVKHLSGSETILGFDQIEGEAADRFANYATIMRAYFSEGTAPGQKVRINVPDGWRQRDLTGEVVSLGDRSLTLSTEQGELTVPYANIAPGISLRAK